MGTNYYFREKDAHENRIEKMRHLLNVTKYIRENISQSDEIKWKVEDLLGNEIDNLVSDYTFHIGKKSVGWKPLLKTNQNLYTTVDEMKDYYIKNQSSLVIIDEYEQEYTWDELENRFLKADGKEQGTVDKYGFCWEEREFS